MLAELQGRRNAGDATWRKCPQTMLHRGYFQMGAAKRLSSGNMGIPPSAFPVLRESDERIIRNDPVPAFVSVINPTSHLVRRITPVMQVGEATLDIVVEARRYCVRIITALTKGRMCRQEDANQARPRIRFSVAYTGGDLPVDVLPSPCITAYQHHGYCRVAQVIITDSTADLV